jgi:Family of unknown function (DUF6055)
MSKKLIRASWPWMAALAGITLAGTVMPNVSAAACVAGNWQVSPANGMPAVRFETTHFAFRWNGSVATTSAASTAGNYLETVWQHFMLNTGFPEPYCQTASKFKVNIHLDPTFGLSGGVDGAGFMGMWIAPPALADRFGLAHEFTHGLQGSTGGLRDSPFTGWMWESHANWMAVQMPEFRNNVHCSELSVNFPHMYYGSTRVRYCNWQFWENLKNRFGYAAVNDIWARAPKRGQPGQPTADPFNVLMSNQGWSIEQLNDVFGDWALRNVNWDYTNPDGSDQGAVYRSAYGSYEPQGGNRLLRTTNLDSLDLPNRRFFVASAWAPQRWGYNIVRLVPDSGATQITVTFRGVLQSAPNATSFAGLVNEPTTVPPPASGWRWGVVAIGSNGRARYSALQRGSDGAVTFPLVTGDRSVWLVVMATPTQMHNIRWDQPYYTIYRYPWMVQLAGAMPLGFQPNAQPPVAGGHQHPNGGGWVAGNAIVDSTAFVGPFARVLGGAVRGNARIEDHAVVVSGEVRDNAVVSALTLVTANTVVSNQARAATVFMGLGAFERNIVLSGTAQNIGDVEQRGVSMNRGVFYGFIDPPAVNDPRRGASLTAPVREVTAPPVYRWR